MREFESFKIFESFGEFLRDFDGGFDGDFDGGVDGGFDGDFDGPKSQADFLFSNVCPPVEFVRLSDGTMAQTGMRLIAVAFDGYSTLIDCYMVKL